MGEIIYWKELTKDDFIDSPHENTMIGKRVLRCDDKRVERAWFTVGTPKYEGENMYAALNLYFKDESRWDAELQLAKNTEMTNEEQEKLISQAESYLQSLK